MLTCEDPATADVTVVDPRPILGTVGPDNDRVSSGALQQLAVVMAATVVVMLLVMW